MGFLGKGRSWVLKSKTRRIMKGLFIPHYREAAMMAHPGYLAKDLCDAVWDLNSDVFKSDHSTRAEVCAAWAIAYGLSSKSTIDSGTEEVLLLVFVKIVNIVKNMYNQHYYLSEVEKLMMRKSLQIVYDSFESNPVLDDIICDNPWYKIEKCIKDESKDDSIRRVRAATAQYRLFNPEKSIKVIYYEDELGVSNKSEVGDRRDGNILALYTNGSIYLIAGNIPKGTEMRVLLKAIESESSIFS